MILNAEHFWTCRQHCLEAIQLLYNWTQLLLAKYSVASFSTTNNQNHWRFICRFLSLLIALLLNWQLLTHPWLSYYCCSLKIWALPDALPCKRYANQPLLNIEIWQEQIAKQDSCRLPPVPLTVFQQKQNNSGSQTLHKEYAEAHLHI